MMRALVCHWAVIFVALLSLAEGTIIASFVNPVIPTDKGTFEIYFDRLKALPNANQPIYPVVVSGNQGAGKSTLLSALSMALGIVGNMFKSANGLGHCTTEVHMGFSSSDGITPFDQPGQQKSNLQAGLNLHSSNVDLMLVQTVSPFANTLLHVCEGSILDSDLQMMSLYSDQRMHTGELSTQHQSFKPDLIIVLKTSRQFEITPGVPCTDEQYLSFTIPSNHALRKTFKSIHLLRMPVLGESEQDLLKTENFRPEQVPKYWAAVQNLKALVTNLAAQVPVSARWTPTEIATVLETNLPLIREGAHLDIPTARTALMLHKVNTATAKAAPELEKLFEPYASDPFHMDRVDALLPALTAARSAAEKTVLQQFQGHESETALWTQIKNAVSASLDVATTAILAATEKKKGEILQREQSAYEIATTACSKARTELKLDGAAATVDQKLVATLRAPIAAFVSSAVVKDVTPSAGYADKLQRLKNDAATLVKAAHDANLAVHINQRLVLKSTPVPAVSRKIEEYVYSNNNTPAYRSYKLSDRFPDFFGAGNKEELLSVSSAFHGTGDGSGSFNLGMGAGRTMVSTGGLRGNKWKYNEIFYNHATTLLEVNLPLGGWSGGRYTNFVEMKDVTLSITQNALCLPENAVFKQAYAGSNVAPVF